MGRKEAVTSFNSSQTPTNVYEMMVSNCVFLDFSRAPFEKVVLHFWKVFPVSTSVSDLNWGFDSWDTLRGTDPEC